MEVVCLSSPLPQLTKDPPKLYPPGKILHVVRDYSNGDNNNNNNKTSNRSSKQQQPKLRDSNENSVSSTYTTGYKIIETDNKAYDEILISPRMWQDHMPQNVLTAMKAVSYPN